MKRKNIEKAISMIGIVFLIGMIIAYVVHARATNSDMIKDALIPLAAMCFMCAVGCYVIVKIPFPNPKHNAGALKGLCAFYLFATIKVWITDGVLPFQFPGAYLAGFACVFFCYKT